MVDYELIADCAKMLDAMFAMSSSLSMREHAVGHS
ncbi:MAG: hypothetical protein QOK44_858 [Betaproteobacteria bacterium]|nr:hypothetical protein [Betaproteobacteria bacterium]